MAARPLFDQHHRDAIRHDLGVTLMVEAAAGTGKTTELLARLVNVVTEGHARIEQVVAVTFTERAAGELKLRLREDLERARGAQRDRVARAPGTAPSADQERLRQLDEALAHLEDARVNTIHGFCADLLRERPVEADVDPRFEVLPEGEDLALFERAFAAWLAGVVHDPPEGLRRALRRLAGEDEREGPEAGVCDAAWQLAQWRDFPAEWTRPPFDRDARLAEIAAAIARVAALTLRPASSGDPLYQDTASLRDFAAELRTEDERGDVDLDGREGRVAAFARRFRAQRVRKGRGSEYRKGTGREQVHAAVEALKGDLDRFVEAADADLAACLQRELRVPIARYERLKRELGRLDFVDLLLRARDLIRDHADVREDFQREFARIFVDEFQDTDPIQAEILLLLAADDPRIADWRDVTPCPGKLFLVGDPKQSIYRFRRADVSTYWAVRDLLVGRGHARLVPLMTSFRAAPAIQRAVNVAFDGTMTADRTTLQADYEPLAGYRRDRADQPHVVALPVPSPYGYTRVAGYAIEASLPGAVGEFVRWLLEDSGWRVTDRTRPDGTEASRSVRAGDVAILFRRFTSWTADVTRPYVEALEARNVPHLLVGGKSFASREEIDSLATALAAIEWPDDELAVFATLRGPFFGFDDQTLLEYRQRFRHVHPFRRMAGGETGGIADVAGALALLRTLHLRRNRVPVADTVGVLLRETRAHAGLVLRPGGEQALANVLHVVELARRYEEGGGLSFRGFVDRLREGDLAAVSEAPIVEEGSDGVRLMTVHKAKGLEFPVVILADITCNLGGRVASRYLDAAHGLCAVRLRGWSPHDLRVHEAEEIARERAEGLRVAYVAATRARDVLVVPAVGDTPFEDRWVSVLNPAIYPALDRRALAEPSPGCPSFGRDSVLVRPAGDGPTASTVRPGRHRFDAASASHGAQGPDAVYDVTWWDPHRLPAKEDVSFGLRHTDLIAPDAPAQAVRADLDAFRAWETSKREARVYGATPALRVETVTERAHASRGEASTSTARVSLVRVADARRSRLGGARFGRLVHEVLASIALTASLDEVSRSVAQHGRLAGADEDERAAATAAVVTVLEHPVLAPARAAARIGGCRRETPVTWTDRDGTLVEGVVDLAYEDEEGWHVLDFKTDREIDAALEIYRAQLALYVNAVAQATARPTQGLLIQI
jgi:ATP-dependent exoDNAse (exonuclease V) beta subunit